MNTATSAILDRGVRGRDGRQAPRWAVRTAHLIPLLVLPSCLWRIALVLGFSMGTRVDGTLAHVGGGEAVYIAGLSVVTEALALLSLGLVRSWGEVVPGWVPLIGHRRVPPFAAIAPAVAGSIALIAIWGFATVNLFVPGRNEFEFDSGWWRALLVGSYLPLLLWGPLLLVLTWAYHQRRCRP